MTQRVEDREPGPAPLRAPDTARADSVQPPGPHPWYPPVPPADGMPGSRTADGGDRSARRHPWIVAFGVAGVLAIVGVVLALVANASGGGSYYTRAVTDHQQVLAAGESPDLARRLVEVDGYHYLDAHELETSTMLQWIDRYGEGAYGAASMHSVIAADPAHNTTQGEVGFLVLVRLEPPPATHLDAPSARAGAWFYNGVNGNSISEPPIDRLEIGDTSVFVFEDPTMPNSRFVYTWLDDDVQGWIDAAHRREVERWLRDYLPSARGHT